MSDEEMIRCIYRLRNTVLAQQKVGKSFKGTTKRYLKAEPQMALDLLYGYITIDSDISYGGGVEWHGNPFTNIVSTIQKDRRVLYTPESTDLDIASSSVAESEPVESLEEIPPESEMLIEETEVEPTEEMVQLIDGTWIEKSKSGPGYQYMQTPSIDETSLEVELSTEVKNERL